MKPHFFGSTLALLGLLSGCCSTPTSQQGRPDYRETMAGKSDEEKRKAAEAHIKRMSTPRTSSDT